MTTWKDIMNVQVTDNRTIVNSVLGTESAVQTSQTRGTPYTYQTYTLNADTLTINQFEILPMFIDEADRGQQAYFGSPEIADFQGTKINERYEALVLAQFASWTEFGQGDLDNTSTDDTTQITVSATNIDNLIRAIRRKINTNNGTELAIENGTFIVWRPEDFELLEQFTQANGFTEADMALKNGIPVQRGFFYGGVTNYLSTSHTANHLFAGVKRVGKDIGIFRGTNGKVKFLEDPPDSASGGAHSGLGIVSRLDYGFSFPSAGPSGQALLELSMDVNVV